MRAKTSFRYSSNNYILWVKDTLGAFPVLLALFLTGCTQSGITIPLSSPSNSPTGNSLTSTPGGAKAVKIILQQSSSGSFDKVATNGTTNALGSGQPANRLFNPDGTSLASQSNGIKSSTWPAWFSSFEIGISGTLNTSSPASACANFASSTESSTKNCTSTSELCGAPEGQFRVSEWDCTNDSAIVQGTGGNSDGVYLRAKFDRSQLGSNENVLVTVEYMASTISPGPTDPQKCFSNGVLSPESCSDFVWRAFLRPTSPSSAVQPFMIFIPPTYASTDPGNSGTVVTTKQIILPLASSSSLTVFQLSRIVSNFSSSATLASKCNKYNGTTANSPFCAGVVFYSITFFRI